MPNKTAKEIRLEELKESFFGTINENRQDVASVEATMLYEIAKELIEIKHRIQSPVI